MKRTLPTWCKEVKKSMIDDDINMTELAERVGMCRNYVSGVVNGRVYAPEIAKKISQDRNITVPYGYGVKGAMLKYKYHTRYDSCNFDGTLYSARMQHGIWTNLILFKF